MQAAGHPAKDKIKPRLMDLSDGWEQLLINCKEKKSRLQEAYQVQNKNRNRTACVITRRKKICATQKK